MLGARGLPLMFVRPTKREREREKGKEKIGQCWYWRRNAERCSRCPAAFLSPYPRPSLLVCASLLSEPVFASLPRLMCWRRSTAPKHALLFLFSLRSGSLLLRWHGCRCEKSTGDGVCFTSANLRHEYPCRLTTIVFLLPPPSP
jgi:hypothetical protein